MNLNLPITLIVLITLFNSACNLYESDAHKFINDNGSIENGKIILSASKVYEQSTCLSPADRSSLDAELNILIDEQNQNRPEISIYTNSKNSHLKTVIHEGKLSVSCVFPLKSNGLDNEKLELILDKSLEVFSDAE